MMKLATAIGICALLFAPGIARAEDIWIDGRIVSIRGNIVAIHPKYGGNVLRVFVDNNTPVSVNGAAESPDALHIGMSVSGMVVKSSDDVVRARSLGCSEKTGRPGTMFGTIVSVDDRTVKVRQRFTSDTITATILPSCHLIRQVALDPDSIKPGDKITVWGGRSDEGLGTDITAYVFLMGKQTYPRSRPDAGSEDQIWHGVVKALHPFTLKSDDGEVITITVPGQIPYSDMRPLKLGELKPGGKVMLIGSASSDGSTMLVVDLVLDAPLIVGLGD
jgi:hypothetical protein